MSDAPPPSAVRRREFLKVLGVTGAATAAVGCTSDAVEKLIPYVVSPDQTVPGVSNYYATTCRECAASCGILAETRDGRAIKLEGNPEHPVNRGALCARGQAALQGLYNPDRYRSPMARRNNRLEPVTWDEALQLFSQRLAQVQAGGQAGNAIFINEHESGSFAAFLDEWLAAFGMPPHVSYSALAESAVMQANLQSFGVAWPSLDFAAARLVISFGADFLDTWGASVPQQLDFADARARLQQAPRLIYVGPRRSLTGLNADDWIACRPGSELAIVNALRGSMSVAQAAEASDVPAESIERLAAEFAAARPSLVLAGGTGANATEIAVAVNALNQSAGNVGVTIRPDRPISAFEGAVPAQAIAEGVTRLLRGGQVPLFMVRGANPVFTLPPSVGFADAMARAAFKVSFSSYPDETTELCDLVLPDHHPLESWGNAQAVPGVISLQQPAMDPVFATRQTADVLIQVARANPTVAARYPMGSYREWLVSQYPGGVSAFTTALTTGLGTGTIARPAAARLVSPEAATTSTDQTQGDFYLVAHPSPALGAGEGANKPWLQELPDPVSKICWQSWVEMHPATAQRLAIENGDLLEVQTGTGRVVAPAYLYPGIRRDTVAIALGRGHTAYGRYARNVGVNALTLLPATFDRGSGALALTATRARVSKTGDYIQLATTEGSARQHGREIARAVLASEVGREEEHGGAHEFPGDAPQEFLPGLRSPIAADAQGAIVGERARDKGMYDPSHWSGMARRRWAMTIDLARCTGCSACITACYAENNIPTVGAPYQAVHTPGLNGNAGGNIVRGREMTWIRLERYFEDDGQGGDAFETRFVPMLCQHCGNAPCEPVCPVFATYHAPDGLNVQVYNRCVGTRYCSNNCPYKVRYFNWFGYGEPARPHYAWPEPLNWQLNPDVNVRGKGVMEKCTFCVQRIREAEHRARAEGRDVRPDEFTVACAQACPSRAITFGDAADEEWSVARLAHDARAYHVFEELNTYTAVVYLKKVNHPAPGTPAPPPNAGGAHG
ncbi:MAG TPA: molybdopterin-dependent oxidoreductase [Gemmatimonadaceae bacterium]|nr:molybdopterin-dependent oxidoreductase [Gemmatimonadaceae bacterium]